MLSRFLSKPSHLRFLTLICSQYSKIPQPHHSPHSPIPIPNPNSFNFLPKYFSSNHNNNNKGGSDLWKFSSENEDSVFGEDAGSLEGFLDNEGLTESGKKGNDNGDFPESGNEFDWLAESGKKENDDDDDIFKGIVDDSKGMGDIGVNDDKAWSLVGEEREGEHFFDIGESSEMSGLGDGGFVADVESEKNEEEKRLLEKEEKELSTILQGKFQFFYPFIYFFQ